MKKINSFEEYQKEYARSVATPELFGQGKLIVFTGIRSGIVF